MGLAEELLKPIITKFKKRKLYSSFIDNISGADPADVQLISKLNKKFIKYTWVIPLKDQKGTTITNVFQQILDESNRKSNKISVDKGSEFYSR